MAYIFCIEYHHNLRRSFKRNIVAKKRHIKSEGADYYTIWEDEPGGIIKVPKNPQPFDLSKNQCWYCHELETELINNAVSSLESHYEHLYDLDKNKRLKSIQLEIEKLKNEYEEVISCGVKSKIDVRSYVEFKQEIEHIKKTSIYFYE